MEALACARTVKAIAAAIVLPLLAGCAGLHLDQGPDQVIQRTEGEDNYAERQKAGPVAARVLPYAMLAEQSYDPMVYATHRIAARCRMRRRRPQELRRACRRQACGPLAP